ncbi:MAG: PAS domain S-box protein [Proteobacteria bacterium]|nr:PAS domain S-box protein [Pseudomonadota bacterium]
MSEEKEDNIGVNLKVEVSIDYCDIFNALPGAVFIGEGPGGRILDVNESMLNLYGFEGKDEVVNRTMNDFCASDGAHSGGGVLEKIRMASGGQPQVFEILAKKKNGYLFRVEMSLKPCLISGQMRVLVMVRDMGQGEHAEDAAKDEQQFTQALLNSLPGIFYVYSYPDYRLIQWNKNHENILGFKAGELKKRYVLDWFQPQDHDRARQALNGVMEKGQNNMEAELLAKDGRLIPFFLTGVRFEASGKVFLVGVGVDISEQKKAEKAFRENVARQRAMIANIADVIAIIDKHGVNRYKSPNIERWFGWLPDDLVGQNAWGNIHPDDEERIKSLFVSLLHGPDKHKTLTDQSRYRCKDGTYKWMEFTAVNLLKDPDINGLLLSYHDITERKRIENEKEKLQDQLLQSRKIEAVGRLAGGVAHDFNNMLSIIIGRAELALMKLTPSEPLYKDLCEIEAVGKRSAELTRQLLAFARKQAIAPRVLDLNQTIESMIKMLRRLIGEDISLIWKPTDCLWAVHMDQAQLDQLLANLMVNARDAIHDVGNVVIETDNREVDSIYCETHADVEPGDYVLLSVSDDGCGIDKGDLPHVFEPFFTTKPLGQGTGLGLATVYGIVKQNRGFINIYSEKNSGTTLNIYLPKHTGNPSRSIEPDRSHSLEGGPETILLVEDEPEILEVAKTMLETMGYGVLPANSPDQAIRLAKEHGDTIHLLMTDVVMPIMNGRELAKLLTGLYPGLKRLFMSGYTANVIANRGVLDEGVNFIQKPFSMKELAEKVRGALHSRN